MSTIRNNQTIMTDELTLFVKTTYYQQAFRKCDMVIQMTSSLQVVYRLQV